MSHAEKGTSISTGGVSSLSSKHGIRWEGHAGAAQPEQVSSASLESQSQQEPAKLSSSDSALAPSAQPPARGPASEDGSAQSASVGTVAAQLPAAKAKASHSAPPNKASAAQSPATAPAAAPKSSAHLAVRTIQVPPPDSATAVQPPAKVSASRGPPGPSSSQAPTRGPQQRAAGAGSSLRPVPVAAPPGLQLPLTALPAAPPQSAQTPISTTLPSRPVLDTFPSEGQPTAPAPVPQASLASSSHQAPAQDPCADPCRYHQGIPAWHNSHIGRLSAHVQWLDRTAAFLW